MPNWTQWQGPKRVFLRLHFCFYSNRAADQLIHGHVMRTIGRYSRVHEMNSAIILFQPSSFCELSRKSGVLAEFMGSNNQATRELTGNILKCSFKFSFLLQGQTKIQVREWNLRVKPSVREKLVTVRIGQYQSQQWKTRICKCWRCTFERPTGQGRKKAPWPEASAVSKLGESSKHGDLDGPACGSAKPSSGIFGGIGRARNATCVVDLPVSSGWLSAGGQLTVVMPSDLSIMPAMLDFLASFGRPCEARLAAFLCIVTVAMWRSSMSWPCKTTTHVARTQWLLYICKSPARSNNVAMNLPRVSFLNATSI